ncbi:MAG: transposase [Lachnospiraceae bacterium]|nr:transposase [Lachnospiraceae bacterium]
MPRKARCKSSTGVYHVVIRGADRRVIFSDDEDNLRFLKVLIQVKKETDFMLYAYCLMGNHAHFLIKEGEVPLGVVFKKISMCSHVRDIGGWEKARRNQAIVLAIGAGISIRQFSRLTAISKTTVERVVRG